MNVVQALSAAILFAKENSPDEVPALPQERITICFSLHLNLKINYISSPISKYKNKTIKKNDVLEVVKTVSALPNAVFDA